MESCVVTRLEYCTDLPSGRKLLVGEWKWRRQDEDEPTMANQWSMILRKEEYDQVEGPLDEVFRRDICKTLSKVWKNKK